MAPNNPLPIHGNEKTMNMNHLILTNIQSSPYFKVNLYELKTYHEVIDEIYYRVGKAFPYPDVNVTPQFFYLCPYRLGGGGSENTSIIGVRLT